MNNYTEKKLSEWTSMGDITEAQIAKWLNEQSAKYGVNVSVFSGKDISFHVSDRRIVGHSSIHGVGTTIEAAIEDMKKREAMVREALERQLKELSA